MKHVNNRDPAAARAVLPPLQSWGSNGENIFFEDRNYRYFLGLYNRYIYPVAETFAYRLLRNYFHFLVRIRTDDERQGQTGATSDWSSFGRKESTTGVDPKTAPVLRPPYRHFNNFFIAYAKAINMAYQRTGSLLEKPYRRKIVTNDAYFTRLIIYIHQNPRGMVLSMISVIGPGHPITRLPQPARRS